MFLNKGGKDRQYLRGWRLEFFYLCKNETSFVGFELVGLATVFKCNKSRNISVFD